MSINFALTANGPRVVGLIGPVAELFAPFACVSEREGRANRMLLPMVAFIVRNADLYSQTMIASNIIYFNSALPQSSWMDVLRDNFAQFVNSVGGVRNAGKSCTVGDDNGMRTRMFVNNK